MQSKLDMELAKMAQEREAEREQQDDLLRAETNEGGDAENEEPGDEQG